MPSLPLHQTSDVNAVLPDLCGRTRVLVTSLLEDDSSAPDRFGKADSHANRRRLHSVDEKADFLTA